MVALPVSRGRMIDLIDDTISAPPPRHCFRCNQPIHQPAPDVRPVRDIIREIAAIHDVTPDDLTGHCRIRRFVRARQHAWFEIRRETPHSYPRIAMWFGGRDHSTIIHGVRAHEERLRAAAQA